MHVQEALLSWAADVLPIVTVPDGHFRQGFKLGVGWYVLSGHTAHTVVASLTAAASRFTVLFVSWNPAGQRQSAALSWSALLFPAVTKPSGQAWHCVLPAAALNVPLGHTSHCPAALMKLPAWHLQSASSSC
jgi:hypothetical protein